MFTLAYIKNEGNIRNITNVHLPIPIANPNRKVVGTCTIRGDDLRGDGKRSQDGEDRHQEAPGDRFAIDAKLADK
jgi:hypothetical protein